jgi:cytidyltransferase-like protein
MTIRSKDKGLSNKMVRALFPGTFDPIHYGHIDIASRASRLFDEIVMAVYDKPLKSLMFSPDERMELVRQAFNSNPKIKVRRSLYAVYASSPILSLNSGWDWQTSAWPTILRPSRLSRRRSIPSFHRAPSRKSLPSEATFPAWCLRMSMRR